MGKSVYEDAAKQAEADIPAKEAEIADLRARLERAQRELTLLRTAVSLGTIGKHEVPSFTGTPEGSLADLFVANIMYSPQTAPPAPPKSAYLKMHEIFRKYGRRFTVKEIVEIFAKEYKEDIPRATLYFALNKGKRKHTFTEENGSWGLAPGQPK